MSEKTENRKDVEVRFWPAPVEPELAPGTQKGVFMRRLAKLGALVGATVLVAIPAQAQLNGAHALGDFGVLAGTQPQPGFYAALFYYHYPTDTIKDADGDKIGPQPDAPGSIAINAYAPLLWYVSRVKVLGANYGAFVVPPWVNGSLEAPAFDLSETSSTSFSDTLIRPIDLGWHLTKADVTAGFQFYAPTGTYELGGTGNTGKGMWTYEPYFGTTVYFDEKKTVSLATTAFWELHGKKKDTDIEVGQILSLEGGIGKSFLGGGLVIGAAYYAQWKLTTDNLGSFVLPGGGTVEPELVNKHRVFALGPDVTLPVATKTKLFALVNLRYLWEAGARSKTEGSTFIATATFPIPSVKLQ